MADKSNREKAQELHSQGIPVSEIAKQLGLSKVSIYNFIKQDTAKAPATGGDLEVQLMRIQLDAVTKERDLYKAEVARLKAMLDE